MKRPRSDDYDENWAMPFGDSIYTHAPEGRVMVTGSAYQRTIEKGKDKKIRRIGFRPPGKSRHRRGK